MSLLDLFNPPVPPKPANVSFVRNDMKMPDESDPSEKKPRRTHCAHGHEFLPQNTKVRKNGSRICLTCAMNREANDRVAKLNGY